MLGIELLVLLLIAYEVGSGIRLKWKTHRRLAAIFKRMAKGQILQSNAPQAGTTDEAASAAWVEKVRLWNEQTQLFLADYSPQAAASFAHDSGGPSVTYHGVSGLANARGWYAILLSRLNNLRGIMEKPDVYF